VVEGTGCTGVAEAGITIFRDCLWWELAASISAEEIQPIRDLNREEKRRDKKRRGEQTKRKSESFIFPKRKTGRKKTDEGRWVILSSNQVEASRKSDMTKDNDEQKQKQNEKSNVHDFSINFTEFNISRVQNGKIILLYERGNENETERDEKERGNKEKKNLELSTKRDLPYRVERTKTG
jgi:hypothetical protein